MGTPLRLLVRIALAASTSSGAACRDAGAEIPRGTAARPGGSAAGPLLSRGRRAVGWSPVPFARAENVNDGNPWTVWGAGKPTPSRPAWVAIDVGVGPRRVILTWSAAGSFNYEETDYGSPGAYRIETSSDSTDGADGTWRTVAGVAPVITHAAEHGFDFAGQRWVKLVVTAAPAESPNGVQIDEIEVRDAGVGAADLWFFMGDSITAMAFGRPPQGEPGFAARVHAEDGRRFPAVIDGGVGGDKSDDGVRHVDEWLARSPDARYWGIGYGTNDAAGDASDTSRFRANMEAIVDRVRAAGRVPILATIPFASDGHHRHVPLFNAAIDEIRRARALPRGPDLYAWFAAHPEELADGVHPDARGVASINRLWARAANDLYMR
jgi:lysophospholipase L1-like esterase